MIKKNVSSLLLVLVSVWWAWTLLVDLVVVRTLFANIDDFFRAGEIGIQLFSKLNLLEVIVGSLIVALLSFALTWNKNFKPFLILSVLTWGLAMFYFAFLIPKIIFLTDLWKRADLMGITSVAGIPDIQQEHQFYHNLYIGLDSFKLILLSCLILLTIWKREKLA